MKRFIYSICLLAFSITALFSQNNTDAERIITSTIAQAKTKAIKTNFTLSVSEKNSLNLQSTTGSFTIKGSKFILEMAEMKAWFDGKTQWAYSEQLNEVSITEPTIQELAEINPISIISAYKTKSSIQFSKTKSKENHIILMTSKAKSDINNVEVTINKTSGNLISIKLFNANKTTTLLTLNGYQKGINLADTEFAFKKEKYKGITINDLR